MSQVQRLHDSRCGHHDGPSAGRPNLTMSMDRRDAAHGWRGRLRRSTSSTEEVHNFPGKDLSGGRPRSFSEFEPPSARRCLQIDSIASVEFGVAGLIVHAQVLMDLDISGTGCGTPRRQAWRQRLGALPSSSVNREDIREDCASRFYPSTSNGGLRRSWTRRTHCGPSAATTLAQLDTLTQSIFLDMFGDPATNPKGWPVKRLDSVCGLVNGRAFKPTEWEESGQCSDYPYSESK